MGKGPEISPVVAGIVIVLIVVVVGVFIYRGTGKKTMSTSDNERMKQMMIDRGFTVFDSSGKKISGGPGAAPTTSGHSR